MAPSRWRVSSRDPFPYVKDRSGDRVPSVGQRRRRHPRCPLCTSRATAEVFIRGVSSFAMRSILPNPAPATSEPRATPAKPIQLQPQPYPPGSRSLTEHDLSQSPHDRPSPPFGHPHRSQFLCRQLHALTAACVSPGREARQLWAPETLAARIRKFWPAPDRPKPRFVRQHEARGLPAATPHPHGLRPQRAAHPSRVQNP
jgi:hypothetical protein